MSFSAELPFHCALEEKRWEGRSKEKNLKILKILYSEMKQHIEYSSGF